MIIRRTDWRKTKVPDKVKRKIWELAEKHTIASIIKFGEEHPEDNFPFDRKTIKKVCEELYRIAPEDLIKLTPQVLYYALKRRPELVSATGLKADKVEKIQCFTDVQWSIARRKARMDMLDLLSKSDSSGTRENAPTISQIIHIATRLKEKASGFEGR